MRRRRPTVVPQHEQVRHLFEVEILPEHARREESEAFHQNRQALLGAGHGCWVCGTRDDLQAHHIFEWALWPALDPALVLEVLRDFDPYGLTRADPDTPISDPDDIRNLLLLCKQHHIGRETGIHAITWPVWLGQKAALPGQDPVPR